MKKQVVYITSRGGTHPIHRAYAESVNADFQYVDFRLRWHDVPAPAWKRYLSWIVCAWIFPNRKSYGIFITGGQQFPAVLMKKLRRANQNQKVVCLNDNETLYFLYTGRYSKLTSIALTWLLKQYDFHICTSKMQTELLHKLTGKKLKNVYTTFNGVNEKKISSLESVQPNLFGYHILLISNLYAGWRLWYKGVDLMLEAIFEVMDSLPISFTIVGQVEAEAYDELVRKFGEEKMSKVNFVGKVSNVAEYIAESSLYLHCARGEAFGISIVEAMISGLPAIVSEWTGAKDIVKKANPTLVVPLNKTDVVNKILWYFKLSIDEKEALSESCRKASQPYTETNAVNSFKKIIAQIAQH